MRVGAELSAKLTLSVGFPLPVEYKKSRAAFCSVGRAVPTRISDRQEWARNGIVTARPEYTPLRIRFNGSNANTAARVDHSSRQSQPPEVISSRTRCEAHEYM